MVPVLWIGSRAWRNVLATPGGGAGGIQEARLLVLQDFTLRPLDDQVRTEGRPVPSAYIRMLSGRLWDFDRGASDMVSGWDRKLVWKGAFVAAHSLSILRHMSRHGPVSTVWEAKRTTKESPGWKRALEAARSCFSIARVELVNLWAGKSRNSTSA